MLWYKTCLRVVCLGSVWWRVGWGQRLKTSGTEHCERYIQWKLHHYRSCHSFCWSELKYICLRIYLHYFFILFPKPLELFHIFPVESKFWCYCGFDTGWNCLIALSKFKLVIKWGFYSQCNILHSISSLGIGGTDWLVLCVKLEQNRLNYGLSVVSVLAAVIFRCPGNFVNPPWSFPCHSSACVSFVPYLRFTF